MCEACGVSTDLPNMACARPAESQRTCLTRHVRGLEEFSHALVHRPTCTYPAHLRAPSRLHGPPTAGVGPVRRAPRPKAAGLTSWADFAALCMHARTSCLCELPCGDESERMKRRIGRAWRHDCQLDGNRKRALAAGRCKGTPLPGHIAARKLRTHACMSTRAT